MELFKFILLTIDDQLEVDFALVPLLVSCYVRYDPRIYVMRRCEPVNNVGDVVVAQKVRQRVAVSQSQA